MLFQKQICPVIGASVALTFFWAFAGVPSALAQEVDDISECAKLLSSPPLDNLLTQNDGQDYGEISSDRQGEVLLGVKCSRDQIVGYFLSANWEFVGEQFRHPYGESGPPSEHYKIDFSLAFCLPRKLPWRLIFYRCEANSGFSMFEGRVTHINAGLNL